MKKLEPIWYWPYGVSLTINLDEAASAQATNIAKHRRVCVETTIKLLIAREYDSLFCGPPPFYEADENEDDDDAG